MADDDDDDYTHLYHNPIHRFGHLPETTRQWLEDLRPDDIAKIQEAVKFYNTARSVGRFNKWLILFVISTFIAAVAFGKSVAEFWAWFHSAK